jgi:hypothetical protein
LAAPEATSFNGDGATADGALALRGIQDEVKVTNGMALVNDQLLMSWAGGVVAVAFNAEPSRCFTPLWGSRVEGRGLEGSGVGDISKEGDCADALGGLGYAQDSTTGYAVV